MDNSLSKRDKQRERRTWRIRKALRGSSEKPRMCVFKSNKHLQVQIIDDEKGVTLASAGTLTKENRATHGKKSKETARHLGTQIAAFAKDKNIQKVVFDRGRLQYHGLIAEVANAAREAGLQF